MQVVPVGAVIVGGKDGLEIVAGAVPNVAQEHAVALIATPALGHRDGAAVGQGEALDVHCVGVGGFAEAPIVGAISAAVTDASETILNTKNIPANTPIILSAVMGER